MQKITTNSSSRTSTRNRSITNNTDGIGANKDEGAVDDHPLDNLNPKQIRQKARDLLKVNDRLVEKISELKSINSQLQRYLYYKAEELQFQESHKNEQLKEVVLANDARIKAIQEINSDDMRRLLVKSIKQIAEEEVIPKERIKLFEAGKVITIFL